MIRHFPIALLLLLCATACSTTVVPLTLKDPAEPLFIQVLEGTSTERSEALAALKNNYPGNPWTSRARTVADLFRSRENQGQKLKQTEQEKAQCQQERAQSLSDLQNLQEASARQREDMEKLKRLLIDMEKRATK